MPRFATVLLPAILGPLCLWSFATAQTTRPALTWDRATLRFATPGGYARLARLKDGRILLSYEHRGRSYVRHSTDDGRTWGEPVLAATCAHGSASNPQPLVLADGTIWLLYNERPRDNKHPFTIRLTTSTDHGKTWTPRDEPLYAAGDKFGDGCWEPAAVQLGNGDVWLLFANEGPYRTSDEQEITLRVTSDLGKTWGPPRTASFRPGHRDGMPVPLVLANGTVVIAIEDNGLTPDQRFKPAIVRVDDNGPPVGDDRSGLHRWPAVGTPWRQGAYAGAPYLCRVPGVGVLLSCQSDEDGKPERMVVYVGDADARGFGGKTVPFPTDVGRAGQWNALFVRNDTTVTAVSSTTINGRSGVWLIDGTFK